MLGRHEDLSLIPVLAWKPGLLMHVSNSHTGEVENGGPQGWHTGEVETGGPLGLLASPSSQSYRLHVQGDTGSKTKMQREAKREEPGMYLSPLHMSTQPCISPSTHPCPQGHMQIPCTQTYTKECSPYVVVICAYYRLWLYLPRDSLLYVTVIHVYYQPWSSLPHDSLTCYFHACIL